MPSQTDLYFPPEDIRYEVEHMPNATYMPIRSIWGHWAGSGMNPDDAKFINDNISELLHS